MKNISLVILAAGMGSRYGGLKQLDGVGPSGEVIMEYSIHDAMAAGVRKVVFVIRESFQKDFEDKILSRLPKELDVELAFQDFGDLPAGFADKVDYEQRQKPWGTGHAVWAARKAVDGPFIAINADDYYGRQAFQRLCEHLSSGATDPCMVGFRLSNTLSPSGTVSRGVCQVSDHGALQSITERTKLGRISSEQVKDEESGDTYSDSVLVSMNCWGFQESFMAYLEQRFAHYLDQIDDEKTLQRGEFYLPQAVDDWRAEGRSPVKVLISEESWLGVTYPEDKEKVQEGMQAHHRAGIYPDNLWS